MNVKKVPFLNGTFLLLYKKITCWLIYPMGGKKM